MAGYDAFISYSHDADGTLAPALQKGLQRLAKPWNRRRAMEVFRDQTGLSATPHLWGSITAALDAAGWFVLLASPESAGSEWVGKEIEYWMASRPDARDRILPVVTGGEWEWTMGGFTPDSTAAHPALRDAFTEEPLYVDLRWATDAAHLELANVSFREAVASIAAPIRAKTPDELISEDLHQFAVARRLRRAAVVALTVLTLAALAASFVAVKQRDTAVTARNEADTNAAQSRSRELAALALNTMGQDPALASLLAVEANYPNGAVTPIDVPEAHRALATTLRGRQWATFTRVGPRITDPATHFVAVDGDLLATIDYTTCVCDLTWRDAATGEPVPSPRSAAEQARLLAPYGEVSDSSESGAFVGRPLFGDFPITDPFTVDATTDLLIGTDPVTGDLVVQPDDGGPVVSRLVRPPGVTLAFVVSLPSGQVVAVSATGGLYQWPLTEGGPARPLAHDAQVRSLGAVGEDRIVVESGDPQDRSPFVLNPCSRGCSGFGDELEHPPDIEVIDISHPRRPRVVRALADPTPTAFASFAVSPPSSTTAQYLAARSPYQLGPVDGQVSVWDLASGELVAAIPSTNPTDLRWLAPDTLAVASARGLDQFRVDAPRIATTPVSDLAVAPSDDMVATLPDGRDGTPSVQSSGPAPGREPAAGAGDGADPSGGGDGPTEVLVQDLGSAPGRLAFSLDGRTLAYSVEDTDVEMTCPPCLPPPSEAHIAEVGDLGELEEVASVPDGRAVAFDPTGAWLAVGVSHEVRILDVDTWEVARSLVIGGVTPRQIVWTPDGEQLLVRTLGPPEEDRSPVLVIDAASGARAPSIPRRDTAGMAVSPDGRTIATGSGNGTVDLWARDGSGEVTDTPIASFVADRARVSGLAFSPDGHRLSVSGDAATLWDLTDPTVPRELEVLSDLPALARLAPRAVVAGEAGRWGLVQFRPDGRALVLAGASGIVELADDDPQLACALASTSDLAAAERVLEAPSACKRVPELTPAPG